MPIDLTVKDIAVLKALLKDGRKSFRRISRETSISTPTVKIRFNRLVNMGVIKSISPILDFDKLIYYLKKGKNDKGINHGVLIKQKKQQQQLTKNNNDLQNAERIAVNLKCDTCKNPILVRTYALKFANIERFFCCTECRTLYKRKYAGRIKSITKRYVTDLTHHNHHLY